MTANRDKAIELYRSGGYTFVACSDKQVYSSSKRGVKPLLELLDSGVKLSGFSAADKVVGSAGAMLYIRLNVASVYADVMSFRAAELLRSHNIDAEYTTGTEKIINRSHTGLCPMEIAVQGISDPLMAEKAIREKLAELNG